jgi:hypothetical protein
MAKPGGRRTAPADFVIYYVSKAADKKTFADEGGGKPQ